MGNRKTRKRRLKRKQRQEEKKAAATSPKADGTRVRRSFTGKARKGDAAEVKLEFSGVAVPVDDPDKDDLEARTRVQEKLEETASKQQH